MAGVECENCKRLGRHVSKLRLKLIMEPTCRNPRRPYESHLFQNIEDVLLEFNAERVWLSINGTCIFKAKAFNSKVLIEHKPQELGDGVAHSKEKS